MTAKLALILPLLLHAAAARTSTAVSTLRDRTLQYTAVCEQIASTISNASQVFYPFSIDYITGFEHWASSSSQASACSVEPGSAEDVGAILTIIASTRTPFAVKGGGHTANPGFSSTSGVHIAMARFNAVVYDASTGTAEVGAGLVWDDVYSALADHNVMVVGGRVTGVGVAGFTLGGGYSWKTSQYGLAIDNVRAFELVLPNGTVTTVTSSTNPDLFFGLKGGFNNFGVVTRFTLATHPQTQVWGGLIVYTGDKMADVARATANFSANNKDPKAAIISELNALDGLPGATLSVFYDAPTPPDGIYDEFLNIQAFLTDISTRSFLSLVRSTPSDATAGLRGAFHTVSVERFTQSLVDVIVNETTFWGSNAKSVRSSGKFTSYDIEPFLPSLFTHGPASAYPPSRARGLLPLNIYFAWTLECADDAFRRAIVQSAQTITAAAVAEGQAVADAALYGNYAVAGTPVGRIYGDHVGRLQAIKARYDPGNVMGLAGGWKIAPKGGR